MDKAIQPEINNTRLKKFRKWVWDRKIYFLVFALPALLMYISYALFGIHPYGDNSVLVLDLNGQYVYYYEAFRDYIHGGNDLFYNWSRNLSGEMFGIFAYYLASSFMLIVCLLPRTMMCGAIELVQILKIGTAALTFAVFLRKTSKPKNISLVVFSLCYSLMSFMVVQLLDPMWLDALIYLPLICLGVQRLVDNGKMVIYIVPLALLFIAHFYMGYMVGIFTFIYFLLYCFTKEDRIIPKKFIWVIVKFALGSIVAIMCAAVVLLPVYNSLKLGKFEFTEPDFSLATQFDFISVLTKLFPMTYDSVNVDGMPMIYCGTITVILIPLFFMNKEIHIKKKVGMGIVASLLLICMYIRPIDMVWHGFQMPNWLPFRYSFLLSFILIMMAYEAFQHLDGITNKEIGGSFFGLIAYLIWCERENYSHFQIFDSSTDAMGNTHAFIQGIWFSAIALVLCFVILYFLKKYKASKVLCIITVMFVSLELVINTMDTLSKVDNEVSYSTYSSYEPYMSNTKDAVSQLKKTDTSPFYRMEATFHRTVNDPIGVGYYGVSHSSSTMNAKALDTLKDLGFGYAGHSTKYSGATYITDAFFDIKYLMDKIDDDGGCEFLDRYPESSSENTLAIIPKGYEKVKEVKEDGSTYSFYKNPYALGLGVKCNELIEKIKMDKDNPFENQNMLFNTLKDDRTDYVEYFERLNLYSTDSKNISTQSTGDGHTMYVPTDKTEGDAHVDYLVEMNRDSDLYMYLPTSYQRECNVWVLNEDEYTDQNDKMNFAGQYFNGDDYSIMNLGEFKKGDKVRVRITIANDDNEAFWKVPLFYSFNFESFEKDVAELQKKSFNITEFEGSYLEGTISDATEGDVLLTTIPYQDGWKITVNGKETDVKISVDSLITIPLEKGSNVITMEFKPTYFTLGKVISIIGLIIVLVIFLFEFKNGLFIRKISNSKRK
ncbi:MAG: YfhO family protein [Oscillospiraceae bacterium]